MKPFPPSARRVVDLVQHRLQRALRLRARYRYVRPRVLREAEGYRIESPCCSRNVDAQGGVIDIALLQRAEDGQWQLLARDHAARTWQLQHQSARLDELLTVLCADTRRLFWP